MASRQGLIAKEMSDLLREALVRGWSAVEVEQRYQLLCTRLRAETPPGDQLAVELELRRWGERLACLKKPAFVPQAI